MIRYRKILAEPLFHFSLAGLLLFIVAGYFRGTGRHDSDDIVISGTIVAQLSRNYESQMGAPPDDATLGRLVDDYVHDEIIYREALKMDLDGEDEIIRRRLIQKLDYLMGVGTGNRPPTEAELQAFYAAHPEQFTLPATATFTHLYFSPNHGGPDAAKARAGQALAALSSGSGASSGGLGDPFALHNDYAQLSKQSAMQLFGDTDMVGALFSAPVRQWAGPFASGYGWHLVFVQRRTPPAVPAFRAVRNKVLATFQEFRRRENREQAFNEIRQHYHVTRDYQ